MQLIAIVRIFQTCRPTPITPLTPSPQSTLQCLRSLGCKFHWNGEALTGWVSQGGSGWAGFGSPASLQTVSSCSLLPTLSHPSTFCPGACWEIWEMKCILLISAIDQKVNDKLALTVWGKTVRYSRLLLSILTEIRFFLNWILSTVLPLYSPKILHYNVQFIC